MRCTILALLIVCGLVDLGLAFTLQSYARVNIVPALEVRLVQDSPIFAEGEVATTAWSPGPDSRITFAVSGPPDLWVKVTLMDLEEEILPPEITSQSGPADQLELTYPLTGALGAQEKPLRSLLLRVEYE